MGVPVLILGESGSGKSTSLRNFDISEVGIFNVAGKPLPFRKKLNKVNKLDNNIVLILLEFLIFLLFIIPLSIRYCIS